MRARLWMSGAVLAFAAGVADAQDSAARQPPLYQPPVPAQSILALRDTLRLLDPQIAKLETQVTAQLATLSRATAMFLRADADLLDASRSDSIGLFRVAAEKRAKIAIDAEVTRMQAERASRAVLTADQLATYVVLSRAQQAGWVASDVAVWQPLVAPPRLSRLRLIEQTDSAEVRISVSPNYAEIYVDSVKVGTGRKFLMLAVGTHEVMYAATGCASAVVPIQVVRGPAVVVPLQTLSCSPTR